MIRIVTKPGEPRFIFLLHDGSKITITRNKRQVQTTEIAYLEEHLNKVPDYMYLPSFSGIPKPVVFLYKTNHNGKVIYYCLSGLWKEIYDFCVNNGIQIELPTDFNHFKYTDFNLTLEEFTEYVRSWGMTIEPRDYQYKAAWKILKYRQSMSQLATRAGKTLLAYMVFRYMLEQGNVKNILMIVPNISLVKQGVADMSQYQEFFTTEPIWAKGEYVESANLTIGTFQSLVRRCTPSKGRNINKHYNPDFFKKFDMVCIDECHKTDCVSIKNILTQPFMKNIRLKFGFSGTIPDSGSIENYACQALLGPLIQDVSTKELVDNGFLAKPVITQVYLSYKDDQKLTSEYIRYGEYLCSNFVFDADKNKVLLPMEERDMTMVYAKMLPTALQTIKNSATRDEYRSVLIDMCKATGSQLLNLEQMIAEHSQKKLDMIEEIIYSWDKNGIVFAHNTEYLKFLYEYFKRRFPNRPIYLITGSTAVKKRDTIKHNLNSMDKDAVLFASYGCVSTGLTFKNLDYCVFAQSFKSKVINFQSIGRGLLLAEDKTEFNIYDLIDCLPTKRLEGQGKKKRKMYEDNNYECKVVRK